MFAFMLASIDFNL